MINSLDHYKFKNEDLFLQALTHKSYFFEQPKDSIGHNEKLEFLGDAVLDLVLSEYLMDTFKEDSEGDLSKKRASLVNESLLAEVAKKINLHHMIRLGRGESQSGGANKPRLLASALEAVVGAVFLDSGYDDCKMFVKTLFENRLQNIGSQEDYYLDYKTRFQEKIQAIYKSTPQYQLKNETGPSHDKTFVVNLLVNEVIFTEGKGKSKKSAEQDAAKKGLEFLERDDK